MYLCALIVTIISTNMKATQEICIIFWEDKVPVGLMLQNGETHFFKVSKARKDYVAYLVGADVAEDIRDYE